MSLNFKPLGKKIEDILGGLGNVANKTGQAIGGGVNHEIAALPGQINQGVVQPILRGGRELSNISTATNPYDAGIRAQAAPIDWRQFGSDFATTALNVAAPGRGKAVLGLAEGLGSRVLRGAGEGSILGGLQGAAGTFANPNATAGEYGRNIATGAGVGALGGAALPVAGAVGGAVIKPVVRRVGEFNNGLGEAGAINPNADIGKPKVGPKRPVVRVDENPDATYQVKTGLPTAGVKPVKLLDKAFRSTRSVIERQGPEGKQLADMLRSSRDTEELHLAGIQKSSPTLHALARKGGKDFENFVDATQGKAKPSSPKIAQAVAEWKTVAPAIRDRVTKAGLDVGDLGPNYYPHFIDFEKLKNGSSSYNQAINHLVSSGQAEDIPAAIKLLGHARDVSRNRTFGSLEASRIVDLPGYDKTSDSLRRYLRGSSRRISHAETFGAKDEKALNLLAKIGENGGDAQSAKNAFDIAVGAKRYGPDSQKITNGIRRYNTVTRLGLGAISNAAQNVNTGIVTGHLRTLQALTKQFSPAERDYVQSTGVISDAVINDLREQSGVIGKGVSKITAPGFGKVETLNRSIAATAGRDYALRLAQRGKADQLRKLGVKGPIEGKTLTKEQQVQASRAIVEKTQFKVDPQDLPGWASSPGGKLVAQFRTFSYNQGKFFSNEILKPMRKGNYMPLARLMAVLPVGYGVYEARRLINNRPEDTSKPRVAAEVFSSIGGAGLVTDIFRSMFPLNGKYIDANRRFAMAAGALGGPSVSGAADLIGGISDAVQRKNIPGTGLDGKVAVAQSADKYTDLTPLARTGLRQIPIIGTRLQNTFVPYQQPDKPVELPVASASAAEGPPTPAAQPDNGSILTGDNTTPESKANAKQATALKKAGVAAGTRLGGTKELDAAQTRIDSATAKFPDGLSDNSKTTLTRYAKLNSKGKDKFNADLNNVYDLKVAQYEQKKRSGELDNTLDDYKAQADVYRAGVQKDFSPTAVKLYGMSKSALKDYFAANPDQQKLFGEVQKLDGALTNAGLQDKNKFANGLNSGGSSGSSNPYKYAVSASAGNVAKPKVSFHSSRAIRSVKSAKTKSASKAKVSIRKGVL